MNQENKGFDEAKEKAAKEHAEEFVVPYGDHGYKIAFESYHAGADFGYQAAQSEIDRLKDLLEKREQRIMELTNHLQNQHLR